MTQLDLWEGLIAIFFAFRIDLTYTIYGTKPEANFTTSHSTNLTIRARQADVDLETDARDGKMNIYI